MIGKRLVGLLGSSKISKLINKVGMYVLIISMLLTHNILSVHASEAPGNPNGMDAIPQEAQEVDVSKPDHIIGTGTPESCTSEAFVKAVAQGGTIVFNGGNKPFTITLKETAKIFNNANPDVVIDGGGLVTLSGGGKNRILYMNTADPKQVWTTDHAQNQDHPRLVVQNIHFANGNSTKDTQYDGGGAIWVRGGRFKVVNCTFTNNVCANKGPDVGGGAIRVFDQYEDLPVYVVNSTFGGAKGLGNVGANGGAISSIGVSWTLINCLFSYNQAIGNGGNPAEGGTPGGGSGGAIYNDGNKMTLKLIGTRVEYNQVNAYGSGIFFVTNDHTGDILLNNSVVENNIGGSWYPVLKDISMHADTKLVVTKTSSTGNRLQIADPTSSKVVVDGHEINVDAYHINGNNYFKLRDVAKMLEGSGKPFEVTWDGAKQAISMISGKPYTSVGQELTKALIPSVAAYLPTKAVVILDGNNSHLTAYQIHNNNYFKLRDLGTAIGFEVTWDGSNNRILIQTGIGD